MIKQKKTKQITVRLTEEEYQYLQQSAFTMGTTASALVRQLTQMSINAARVAERNAKQSQEALKPSNQ